MASILVFDSHIWVDILENLDQLAQDTSQARADGNWSRVLELADIGLTASDRGVFKVCRFQALAALGRKDEALAFADGLSAQDKLGGMLLPLARELCAAVRFRDALILLDQAPADRRTQANFIDLYFKCFVEVHGAEKTIEFLRNAREKTPDRHELTAALADLLALQGQSGEAIEILQASVAQAPDLTLQLARFYLDSGQYQDVRDIVLSVPDMLSSSPPLMVTLSWACIHSGTPDVALERITSVMDNFPSHPALNSCYWSLLAQAGKPETARTACLTFADRSKQNLDAQPIALRFLQRRELFEDAETVLHHMRQLAPDSEQTLAAEIEQSQVTEAHDNALSVADRAVRLHPNTDAFRVSRIRAMLNLGQHEAVLAHPDMQDNTLRLGPVLLPLADSLVANGQARQARALFRDASEIRDLSPAEMLADLRACLAVDGPGSALMRLTEMNAGAGMGPAFANLACQIAAAAREAEEFLDTLPLDWSTPQAILARAGFLNDQFQFEKARDLLQANRQDLAHLPGFSLLLVQALVGMGQGPDSLETLERAVEMFPDNFHIHSTYWKHLCACGREADARAAAVRFLDDQPTTLAARLTVVEFLAQIKDWAGSLEILDQARDHAPDDLQLLLKHCSLLERQDDVGSARELLLAYMENRAWSETTVCVMAGLEAKLGCELAAIARLEAFLAANPLSHRCRTDLIQLLLSNDLVDDAKAHLAKVNATNRATAIRIRSLEAEAAFQSNQRNRAVEITEEALRKSPESAYLLQQLSRFQLLLGDIEGAWRDHGKASKLIARRDISHRLSAKPMKSVQGQLLNEFRLQGSEIDFTHCAENAQRPAALKHFKTVLSRNPGNLPAAIYLFDVLKRARRKAVKDSGTSSRIRIPKTVFQFWDQPDPPPEIGAIMAANRQMNPDYRFEVFDNQRALAYLREKGESQAVRGFRLAPGPAAKADIFRLAILFHEGGIYMDADDGTLAPLGEHIDHARRFVGYYESTLTVGNNFIAVRPKDPIIRFALSAAATAFDGPRGEPLWMASGPAVITRALAIEGTRADGHLKSGIQILGLGELRRFIAPHIRVPYKNTNTHWVHTMTHREGA